MTTYCEFKFSLFLVIITIFIFRNKETKKKTWKNKVFPQHIRTNFMRQTC